MDKAQDRRGRDQEDQPADDPDRDGPKSDRPEPQRRDEEAEIDRRQPAEDRGVAVRPGGGGRRRGNVSHAVSGNGRGRDRRSRSMTCRSSTGLRRPPTAPLRARPVSSAAGRRWSRRRRSSSCGSGRRCRRQTRQRLPQPRSAPQRCPSNA